MDSEDSGPSRRKNLRSATTLMPVHTIDSDCEVQEVASVPKPRVRAAKRIKRADNAGSPITVDDGEDAVRAPIPQQTATLSGADPFAVLSRQFDIRKNYKELTARSRKEQKVQSRPVFDSLRDDSESRAFVPSTSRATSGSLPPSRSNLTVKLADMFRPAAELLTCGTFDHVRGEARKKTRWLLVTIHNYQEFDCQKFVRDVLNHDAVKEIIKENFVFWTVNYDTPDGLRYCTHYNVHNYPYLAIIDPRTGEKVLTYDTGMTVLKFCNVTTQFLAEKPSYDPTAPEACAVRVERSDSTHSNSSVQIIDEEEEEIQRAIRLSELEEEKKKKQKGDLVDIDDCLSVGLPEDDDDLNAAEEPKQVDPDSYKQFLGPATDPQVALKIRLPVGDALDFTLPNSSQLQAVWKYIEARGFPAEQFDIITSFPKRCLSTLEKSMPLTEAGFSSREMLIVQQHE